MKKVNPRYLNDATNSNLVPSKYISTNVFLPFSKIITFVLSTLTFKFHLLQYTLSLSSIFCRPVLDLEKITASSAYIKANNGRLSEDDIVRMLDLLIDNIFVECGGVIFQQVIGIPMGTNCAPLLADLFLYSYEAEYIQTLIKSGKRHLAKSFCFTFRYIDDVLSINNPTFGDYINIIYPVELEIKDTTDADHHASYLDLLLKYDNFHRLQVKLYDKRDDFNFDIVNFPFLSSNIPQSPAYGVFVSQLIRYARAASLY